MLLFLKFCEYKASAIIIICIILNFQIFKNDDIHERL